MTARRAQYLLPGLLACALPAAAAEEEPPYTEIGFSHGRETLSNHPNDWIDTQLEVVRKFGRRKVLIGRVTSSERFGLHDSTIGLAGYHPLGERTVGYAEVSVSDTHRVLPRDSVHVQLAHSLAHGWGVIGGLKHMTYNVTEVDIAELTVERYFSSYRAAFSVYPSHSRIAGSATSYRMQVGWYYGGRYYGEENNVQLLYASGVEVDKPTGVDSVLATPVRAFALFGRHWVAREWALAYGVSQTKQGSGTRNGVNLGLRYRF
jgi:YaiO family outer membrane protein